MGYDAVVFKEKTVFLVTGGAGFIGSNLCEALLQKGCKVRCLDDFSTGKRENIEPFLMDPNFTLIEGDIRSMGDCMNACRQVEYVLHQAAWGSVPRSIEMPLFYEEVNIKGTLNMLEAARQSGVKRFVYASSSSVYGDDTSPVKTEQITGNVLSPYALTKKVNEAYAMLYSKLYGLETIGLRYFNVFGRRQNPDGAYAAVIPRFIAAFLNGEKPLIYGDGKQSRDFTYIDNVIEANLKACVSDPSCAGNVFNVACGDSVSVLDVFEVIQSILNCDIQPLFMDERKGDIRNSRADISRTTQNLDYRPAWSFSSGIEHAINWYVDNGI